MNSQFKNTRLKLTFQYLAILMVVSTIFSIVTFISLNAELLRSARREQQRVVATELKIELPKPLPDPKNLPRELVDPPLNIEIKQTYTNSKNLLILQLILANILVLGLSTVAAYILAGNTLKPIEEMIDDQKKFISNASHELRTPLTTLKTAIEVTLKMGPTSYDRIKDVLESNLEDVNSLETLTNNLLTIEKYQHNQDLQNKNILQFDKLVNDCIKHFIPKAKVNNIKIISDINSVSISGNYQCLAEMVNNLLDNAIKYNQKKGKIFIKLFSKNKNIFLQIKDTGIGINPSDIPHIFERFYRADNSRSKINSGGYGLGLSIVSQVVKQHQGKILVDSELGKGTTFTVIF